MGEGLDEKIVKEDICPIKNCGQYDPYFLCESKDYMKCGYYCVQKLLNHFKEMTGRELQV